MKSMLTLILVSFCWIFSRAHDTLYFRIQNPYNCIKDPNGKYLRKAILTADSGWHALDYNEANILVASGYYADTSFTLKTQCHVYYNESRGFREMTRCFKDGKIDGVSVGFNEKGDTLWKKTFALDKAIDEKYYPGYERKEPPPIPPGFEPEFPGGQKGWAKYLAKNLRYPDKAFREGVEGTVVLTFIVSKEGDVTEVKVAASVNPLLDVEAVRILQSSPKWIPAMQNGKPVKAWQQQPIVFKIP